MIGGVGKYKWERKGAASYGPHVGLLQSPNSYVLMCFFDDAKNVAA